MLRGKRGGAGTRGSKVLFLLQSSVDCSSVSLGFVVFSFHEGSRPSTQQQWSSAVHQSITWGRCSHSRLIAAPRVSGSVCLERGPESAFLPTSQEMLILLVQALRTSNSSPLRIGLSCRGFVCLFWVFVFVFDFFFFLERCHCLTHPHQPDQISGTENGGGSKAEAN